jgi:hypothetical protein
VPIGGKVGSAIVDTGVVNGLPIAENRDAVGGEADDAVTEPKTLAPYGGDIDDAEVAPELGPPAIVLEGKR